MYLSPHGQAAKTFCSHFLYQMLLISNIDGKPPCFATTQETVLLSSNSSPEGLPCYYILANKIWPSKPSILFHFILKTVLT